MLILFLAIPVCLGLAAGCCAFWICSLLPHLRRFALGLALWCAAWGFFFDLATLLNFTAIAALWAVTPARIAAQDAHLLEHFGKWAWLNVVLISFAAAVIALAHGFTVRRATLALFRWYATAVACGVALLGVVFSVLYLGNASHPSRWLIAGDILSLFAAIFSIFLCQRRAAEFRGKFPERWNWITREEYEPARVRPVIEGRSLPDAGATP